MIGWIVIGGFVVAQLIVLLVLYFETMGKYKGKTLKADACLWLSSILIPIIVYCFYLKLFKLMLL